MCRHFLKKEGGFRFVLPGRVNNPSHGPVLYRGPGAVRDAVASACCGRGSDCYEHTKRNHDMNVHGKTMVVTGGGSGIGRELVLALLQRGARVAAVDLNEKTLKETLELAGEAGDRASLHTLDITDKAAVDKLPGQVKEKLGEVDGLVNNAGIIQPFLKVNNLDFDAINKVMNVNLDGVFYMTKAFLPRLLERPEAHLVNVSSMGGFLPVPGQSIYGASKAAVKLFSEGLYAELLNTNVRVTTVFPGAIATNISSNSGVGTSEEKSETEDDQGGDFNPMPAGKAAQVILKAIEKDRFRVMVGKDARFMDLIYRLNPRFATRYITKKMASLLN